MIWPILEARAEIEKYFRSFLVQMKTSKSHSENIWPLVAANSWNHLMNFMYFGVGVESFHDSCWQAGQPQNELNPSSAGYILMKKMPFWRKKKIPFLCFPLYYHWMSKILHCKYVKLKCSKTVVNCTPGAIILVKVRCHYDVLKIY